MNQNLKRWLISTGVTFSAGFAITLLADIDHITLVSLHDGALVGIVFAAIRAGVKAVLEAFVALYANK